MMPVPEERASCATEDRISCGRGGGGVGGKWGSFRHVSGNFIKTWRQMESAGIIILFVGVSGIEKERKRE